MDFVTNTATNPERSERRSTVTLDETPASRSEQNRERRLAGIRSRRRKVHDWRKLAEISEEKAGASSKHFLDIVRKVKTRCVRPVRIGEDEMCKASPDW